MIAILAQAESDTKGLFDNGLLDEFEIPFGEWMDQSVDWIATKGKPALDAFAWPFETLIDLFVNDLLAQVSWVWVVLGMMLIAALVRNIRVAVFVGLSLTLCGFLGNAFWLETSRTIGFIGVAVFLCVLIGIPIGVAAGRVDGVWSVTRPVLDAMQVVHSFVYMLPFIFFFGIGEVSATMVTMVFALPPLIRLTNLGIRQVPSDVVEASRAYGAPEWRVLFDVQLPLARPAIMTGINQTLLLAISMLGIAAIMGAGGLGTLLFRALSNQKVSLAAAGGLAFFLVAVVLDRMSQREDADTGNLFTRIREAWVHRRDPEALLPDDDDGEAAARVVTFRPAEQFAPITAGERARMSLTALGAVLAAVATFLTWTTDAGKMSAFGRRIDENLPGESFSGLHASGGSWFGMIVLGLAAFVLLAVIVAYLRPGRGPRWLAADGALLASLAMLVLVITHIVADQSPLALDPGIGIGVILALVGSVVATVGSGLWIQVAEHSPLHPLRAGISWGRLIGVGIAVLVLVAATFSGWSFDARGDVVISPEIQAKLDELRARAEANPADAGPIAAEISATLAEARREGAQVTDGLADDGPRLGLWTLLTGLLGGAATLPAIGLFGRGERRNWIWSTVAAGIGLGGAVVALGWILTHVRSADPNYFSGIGAFLALCGGFFVLASTLSVLKEFRRSKVYDDERKVEAAVPATSPVDETVEATV